MNKFVFTVYRVVVPKPLRTILLKKHLRKKIIDHFSSIPYERINNEQKEVLTYLKENNIAIFPYPFSEAYSEDKIEVFYNSENRMSYVMHEGKPLYFKRRWGPRRIRKAYSDLSREQDPVSPHRYLNELFDVGPDDVIADIGAAEGNFSLSVIEKVKKIYLFEYDREWSEALKATFAPWNEKVIIINKYVSNLNDDSNVRFDTFFKDNSDINFLKIDVDGAESTVLESCRTLFGTSGSLRIALCTYHKDKDEEDFTRLLKSFGFIVSPSSGYMINYYDKKIGPPYLRRGLIRAIR